MRILPHPECWPERRRGKTFCILRGRKNAGQVHSLLDRRWRRKNSGKVVKRGRPVEGRQNGVEKEMALASSSLRTLHTRYISFSCPKYPFIVQRSKLHVPRERITSTAGQFSYRRSWRCTASLLSWLARNNAHLASFRLVQNSQVSKSAGHI